MPGTFRIIVFAIYCLGLPSILLAEHPNIIFLLSDDQRPDTIAALGNPVIQTPNLDRLVREGSTFTRATCANPLCVPSRAEILSGQTGFRNGGHDKPIQPNLEHTTWPQAMQKAGYNTYWVGKWMIAGRPSTRGYQESLALFSSGGKPPEPQFDYAGREVTGYRGWVFQTDDKQTFPEKGVGLTPDIESKFANAAIEFIQREHSKPYFLHVNFTAPHDPLLMPPGWEDAYTAVDILLSPNYLPQHPFDHGNFDGRDERLFRWPRTKLEVRTELAAYYAVISDVSRQVGRIRTALRQQQIEKNSIVVFTSDHGLAVGSHGLRGKQNMYDHSIKVPFIIAGPGIARGVRTGAFGYLRDMFPTTCELAGIAIPKTVQSHSLSPVLLGKQKTVHRLGYGYFRDAQRMVRDENWKLIFYPKLIDQNIKSTLYTYVHRAGVWNRVNGDRLDAHRPGSLGDSASNLATVRNQDLFKGRG